MIPPGKVRLAILQPTPFCNIDCKYCYLPDKSIPNRMQPATVQRLFEFLFSAPDLLDENELTIAWVAGEPLSVPISFYDGAVDIQQRMTPVGINAGHYFQSNGTLLDQPWCDFIKHRKWNIGISLDGPKRFHDARRIDRAGRGTHDRVMRGIHLLQDNGIPFDIIGVLSIEALECVEEVFDFYSSLKPIQIGLNFEDVVGTNQFSSFHGTHVDSKVTEFMCAFLELRNKYAPTMHLREIDPLLEAIANWKKPFRWMDTVPLRIVSISWKGEVSTFSPELIGIQNSNFGNFVFGSVFDNSLGDILKNQFFLLMQKQVENGIKICQRECSYYGICGGGSPSHKLAENGTFESAETVHCRLRVKRMSDVVLKHLERKYCLHEKADASILERVKWLLPLVSSQRSAHSLSTKPRPLESYI